MSHRKEAEILLSRGHNENLARAQVHALLAIAEALETPVPEPSLQRWPANVDITESSHGENCNRCGTPTLSPWMLRVWTVSDERPTHRTDIYLCDAHVPTPLPAELTLHQHSHWWEQYERVIRPLLKFDGADTCVITAAYLARNS